MNSLKHVMYILLACAALLSAQENPQSPWLGPPEGGNSQCGNQPPLKVVATSEEGKTIVFKNGCQIPDELAYEHIVKHLVLQSSLPEQEEFISRMGLTEADRQLLLDTAQRFVREDNQRNVDYRRWRAKKLGAVEPESEDDLLQKHFSGFNEFMSHAEKTDQFDGFLRQFKGHILWDGIGYTGGKQ